MNRRNFIAAVIPIMALGASASGQLPISGSLTDEGVSKSGTGLLNPANAAGEGTGIAGDKGKEGTEPQLRGPTEITSREAVIDNKISQATFSGEVFVKNEQFEMTCDRLTCYLKKRPKSNANGTTKKPPEAPVSVNPAPIGAEPSDVKVETGKPKDDSGSQLEKAVAEGNVVIRSIRPDEENPGKMQRYQGKGRKAVLENEKQVITLYGMPRVMRERGPNQSDEMIALEEQCVIVLSNERIEARGGKTKTVMYTGDMFGPKPQPGSR